MPIVSARMKSTWETILNTASRVSVVVPHHNSSQTIGRCLDSILSQTLRPVAVIVVDDKSDDRELGVLKSVIAGYGDPRLHIIELRENAGPAGARNAGWDLVESEYVAFCDSDDWWHPQKLEVQFGVMSLTGAEISGSLRGTRIDGGIGEEIRGVPFCRMVGMRDMLIRNVLPTSTVVVPTFGEWRFNPNRRYAEDAELWHIILSRVGPAAFVDVELAYDSKEAIWASGLSSAIWKMIGGEFETFWLSKRRGIISSAELLAAWSFLILRVVRRLIRFGLWRVKRI